MADNTYAPKLPLETSNYDFIYIEDALQNVKQDLRMLILTNPGEKIMDPEYGIGIRRYLFEPTSGVVTMIEDDYGNKRVSIDAFQQQILVNLTKQTNKYNPEIDIRDLRVTLQDNVMYLEVYYQYRGFISDSIGITVNM